MEKIDFYSVYEDEHQKTKTVVDNWDCKKTLTDIENVLNDLNSCDFTCDDDIGKSFFSSKSEMQKKLNDYTTLMKNYDTHVKECYVSLLEMYEQLKDYNNRLQVAYTKKPTPPSHEGVNSILGVSIGSEVNYLYELDNWKRAINNLKFMCEYLVNNIASIKEINFAFYNNFDFSLDDCNGFVKNLPFTKIPLDSDVVYDEYGCPENIQNIIFDITTDEDYYINTEIINVHGVDIPTYSFIPIDADENEVAKYDDYIQKSREYMELIPKEILEDVVEFGVSIAYVPEFLNGAAGMFLPTSKKIVLDPNIDYMSYTILHETGHSFDNFLGEKSYGVENCFYSLAHFESQLLDYQLTKDKIKLVNGEIEKNFLGSSKDAEYLQTIDGTGYDYYSFITMPYEFFAESFSCYLLDNDCLNLTDCLGKNVTEMIALADKY